MKRLIWAIVVGLALSASACLAAPAGGSCVSKYYHDKSAACLAEALRDLRDRMSVKPDIDFTMVGFLAALIKTSPAARDEILAAAGPPAMKTIILLALDRAGRDDAARDYGRAAGLQDELEKLEREAPPQLDQIRPRSAATDNDMMTGAFMATGDPTYIATILGNFAAASDDQVADAVRIALMQTRFEDSDPHGGYRRLSRVVCAKYDCRRDMTAFSRVLTLASAYWEVNALADDDETVRKARQGFLNADPRVGAIERNEEEAFEAYVDRLAAWTAAKGRPNFPDKAGVEQAMSDYENLGPALDLLRASSTGR